MIHFVKKKKSLHMKSKVQVSGICIILKKQIKDFLFNIPPIFPIKCYYEPCAGKSCLHSSKFCSQDSYPLYSQPLRSSWLPGHTARLRVELGGSGHATRGPGRSHCPLHHVRLPSVEAGAGSVIKGQLEAREPAATGGAKGTRILGM